MDHDKRMVSIAPQTIMISARRLPARQLNRKIAPNSNQQTDAILMQCETHHYYRQYLIHVPGNYSPEKPTFLLCGTGAGGTRTVEPSPSQSGTGAVRPYSSYSVEPAHSAPTSSQCGTRTLEPSTSPGESSAFKHLHSVEPAL